MNIEMPIDAAAPMTFSRAACVARVFSDYYYAAY